MFHLFVHALVKAHVCSGMSAAVRGQLLVLNLAVHLIWGRTSVIFLLLYTKLPGLQAYGNYPSSVFFIATGTQRCGLYDSELRFLLLWSDCSFPRSCLFSPPS